MTKFNAHEKLKLILSRTKLQAILNVVVSHFVISATICVRFLLHACREKRLLCELLGVCVDDDGDNAGGTGNDNSNNVNDGQ